MSESNTAVVDAPAPVAAPEEINPLLSADDSKIKAVDAMERATELLTLANNQRALRGDLDKRAFELWAKNLVIKDDGPVVEHREELPAYGMAGVGSLRYTKQRALLLMAIAEHNSVTGKLTFTRYTYPNPSTSRRRHYAILWGTKSDIQRTLVMFRLLQARALGDAYNSEVLTFTPEVQAKPAQQTRVRRAWMIDFAGMIDDTLEAVKSGKSTATKALADRSARAQEAYDAWTLENSAKGDAAVEVESVHEA